MAGYYDLYASPTTESPAKQRNRLSLTKLRRERQNVSSRSEAYTSSSTTSTTNERNDTTNDITVELPTFTLSNLESSSSEEDSSISANEDTDGVNDDDGDDAQFLRTRTQILKRRPNDTKLESSSSNYTTASALGLVGNDSSVSVHRSRRRRPSVGVAGYESTREHTIDIDSPDDSHYKGNQWQIHDTDECSSSRNSNIHDSAAKPLQKTYVGLRQLKPSPFLPPSVTKSASNRSWNSTNHRGTFSPEKRQPHNRCIDLVDDALVDSTTSEESDDDDVLIVLPPPPKNSNERNGEATQDKTSLEPSSRSWLPQWNENGGTPPHSGVESQNNISNIQACTRASHRRHFQFQQRIHSERERWGWGC